jgi:hypothetical protein
LYNKGGWSGIEYAAQDGRFQGSREGKSLKILILFGSALVGLSALCFYAEHKRQEGIEDAASSAVQRLLQAESRSLEGRLDEALLKADRDALNASTRWKKKSSQRGYASDIGLAEPDMPRWLVVGGKKVRAAGLVDDALLEDALEAHAAKGERFSLYSSKGKFFLFVRGSLVSGERYAAAYSPEAFFLPFQTGEGLRIWAVNTDGTVLYHPLQRFIGSNAANLRPVAAAIQKLAEGRATEFSQRYLGLEGKTALGAWSVMPGQGLVMASEWPHEPGAAARFGLFFWVAMLLGAGGFALVGAAMAPRAAGGEAEGGGRIFDLARLDEDAMEYLEQAKAAAEKAVEFAKEQEKSAEQARKDRSRALMEVRQLEARIARAGAFQERILPHLTGKQVWVELGRMLQESAPGLTVIVYRYSTSTFSLVPETLLEGPQLEAEARVFLRDTRIFLGNLSYLPTLLKTEAFAKWNRTRERHMTLKRCGFRVIPYHGLGVKGALLAVFDERLNQYGELDEAFAASEAMVQRTGTFCDSLTPLIQSIHAKGNAGTPLAGAANSTGNRPRPS